ncbi:hypothetical protein V6N12_061028 [Hibiscus sabdariffa]|uniref:Uncharacterized protein n=1 Tax=Hibiscus sabdariffa TaxID=183260 RepID=A0ABR2DX24_9ROSI
MMAQHKGSPLVVRAHKVYEGDDDTLQAPTKRLFEARKLKWLIVSHDHSQGDEEQNGGGLACLGESKDDVVEATRWVLRNDLLE